MELHVLKLYGVDKCTVPDINKAEKMIHMISREN